MEVESDCYLLRN